MKKRISNYLLENSIIPFDNIKVGNRYQLISNADPSIKDPNFLPSDAVIKVLDMPDLSGPKVNTVVGFIKVELSPGRHIHLAPSTYGVAWGLRLC